MTVLGTVLTAARGSFTVSVLVTALMLALDLGDEQKRLQSPKATESACRSNDEKRDQGHGDLN